MSDIAMFSWYDLFEDKDELLRLVNDAHEKHAPIIKRNIELTAAKKELQKYLAKRKNST
jgi:hypothetical protein